MSKPEEDQPLDHRKGQIFPATRWSLIQTAQDSTNEKIADKAVSELFEIYWYPVYGYFRRKGSNSHDAEDLTQAFFEAMIRRDSLKSISESKGTMRAFLLSSLKNFFVDRRRIDGALKRGGGQQVLSIDWKTAGTRYELEPMEQDAPDVLFERAWARSLLEGVMAKLALQYTKKKKETIYAQMSSYLLKDETPPYLELTKNLGVTVMALRIFYHRMRQRYGELLTEEIRQTVSTDEEAAEEQAYLMRVWACTEDSSETSAEFL